MTKFAHSLPSPPRRAVPAVGHLTYRRLLAALPAIERADLDADTLAVIAARLTDPVEVAAAGVLPPTMWQARHHSGSMLFEPELEQALALSMTNLAPTAGRSLVLVDVSGSMRAPIAGHVGVCAYELAAVLGAALVDAAARGGGTIDLVLYASDSVPFVLDPNPARAVRGLEPRIATLGHADDPWTHVRRWYDGHDRVLVCTDGAGHPGRDGAILSWDIPVLVWDLRGSGHHELDRAARRYLVSGPTDAAVTLLTQIDRPCGARRNEPPARAKCARLRG